MLLARLCVVVAPTLCLALPAQSQTITQPWASPHASVSHTIGINEVVIDYHSPGVKGRTIWGGLVPYDDVWRAGANDNTTISFQHPVTVEGKPLAAGTYGLHMIPTESGRWTIIFSTNHTSWGSFSYDEKEDAARIQVMAQPAPHREWLMYSFDDYSDTGATASMHWDKLKVPFRIETDTHNQVLANARNELRHRAGFTWRAWYDVAQYAVDNDVELERALEWIDESIRREKNYRNMSAKSQILAKLDRNQEAERVMAEAMELAGEGDINRLGYTYLQSGDTDQALKMFKRNTKEHPDSWNVWDSLAEAYAGMEDNREAIRYYKKALKLAPPNQHARIERALNRLQKNN